MTLNKSDKKIVINYLYNLVYQIVAMIIPLVTTPYVSRVLKAEGVGEYSFAFSCVSLFVIIGNFGFSTYGQLNIAGSRNDKDLLARNLCGIFLSRMILMLISAACYFIYMLISGSMNSLFYILFIHILAAAIDISWFFQGIEDFKMIAMVNSLTKILGTVLVFVLVKSQNDVDLYALIISISLIVGNVVYFFFLGRNGIYFTLRGINLKMHMRASVIYFVPTIATSVYTVLDKSMIGWITSSDYENGIYEQAQKIIHMCTTVVTSISMVIMPRMAALYHNDEYDEIKNIFLKYSSFVLLLAFPMTLGLSAISGRLVILYLGPGFEACKELLIILSPLIILIGMDNAIGQQILIATRKQKQYNAGVVFGSITNLLLNFLLIRICKSTGAAVASVISELVITILFIVFSHRIVSYTKLLQNCWKIIIASLGMMAGVIVTNQLFNVSWGNLVIEVCIAVVIYFLLLLAIKEDTIIHIICAMKKRKS